MILGGITALLFTGVSVFARPAPITDARPTGGRVALAGGPSYCIAAHNVGQIALSVTNYGVFGAGAAGEYSSYIKGDRTDCFTGKGVPDCEYPKGSGTEYLYSGNFWIGAVVGRDTLVSVGADGWQQDMEFNPDAAPFGDMIRRSIIDPTSPEYEHAISEQDYIAVYTDTFKSGVSGLQQDAIDRRPHRPLYIEATQRSYAWSYSYAEDFVLFDFDIRNIGTRRLNQVYMGLYVDADVGGLDNADRPNDDVCGFLQSIPSPKMASGRCFGDPAWRDTVNLAWIADNDGDLDRDIKVPNITGMRIVRTPSDSLDVSFNWWVGNTNPSLDFGPQSRANYRDLGTGGEGTPEGDRNKYAFLRNKEHDYDQIFTASIPLNDSVWKYPPNQRLARDVSKGYDTRYLLSFGPFNLDPGQTVPLSFAYVGGMNFHTDPTNARRNLIDMYNPESWYRTVDFTEDRHAVGKNAMWADWIYDNPGVDSDNDGYAGKFRVCAALGAPPETLYYQGDGVPDFRGASPPPAPQSWLLSPEEGIMPTDGRIIVRFNGTRSENTADVFTRKKDFEGYRVYVGLDDRATSFSPDASYDIEDYNRYVQNDRGDYALPDEPYTLDSLRSLYAPGGKSDTTWYPLAFSRSNPFHFRGMGMVWDTLKKDSVMVPYDSAFCFTAQDNNNWRLGVDTRIARRYPDAPVPPVDLVHIPPTPLYS